MAAKTFGEFWKNQQSDISNLRKDEAEMLKSVSKLTWIAATEAAEEKFTAGRTLAGAANNGSDEIGNQTDMRRRNRDCGGGLF